MVEYDYSQYITDKYFKFAESNDEPDEAELAWTAKFQVLINQVFELQEFQTLKRLRFSLNWKVSRQLSHNQRQYT